MLLTLSPPNSAAEIVIHQYLSVLYKPPFCVFRTISAIVKEVNMIFINMIIIDSFFIIWTFLKTKKISKKKFIQNHISVRYLTYVFGIFTVVLPGNSVT